MNTKLKDLIGRKITKIFLDTTKLKFETDQGDLFYMVAGGCCSHSYFHDFYGVKNLLENGKVVDVKEIELTEDDKSYIAYEPEKRGGDEYDSKIACYGYQITTESPEFGEVTSTFSFRNASNGYYGGEIYKIYPKNEDDYVDYHLEKEEPVINGTREITDDVVEVKD